MSIIGLSTEDISKVLTHEDVCYRVCSDFQIKVNDLNYWPGKGTLQYDGLKALPQKGFEAFVEELVQMGHKAIATPEDWKNRKFKSVRGQNYAPIYSDGYPHSSAMTSSGKPALPPRHPTMYPVLRELKARNIRFVPPESDHQIKIGAYAFDSITEVITISGRHVGKGLAQFIKIAQQVNGVSPSHDTNSETSLDLGAEDGDDPDPVFIP